MKRLPTVKSLNAVVQKLFQQIDRKAKKGITPLAWRILGDAVRLNNGIIVAESLYDSPEVKNSSFSVLSGDQSYIDHRDPKKEAEVLEALSVLEKNRLIAAGGYNRSHFRITERGMRYLEGRQFPTQRQLKKFILIAALVLVWFILVILAFQFAQKR